MRARWPDRAVTPLLVLGSFGLAFGQRPGLAVTDTKIDLYVSPIRYLANAASTWGSSYDLGHVQGGQTSGYLFPMGPFFALGHVLGLSPWVIQRLWLGTLLALTAWGTVRLMDALLAKRQGVAALVAGAVAVMNPFVVVYANRTTVTLLASAALPWLLLCVHRGLRDSRRWTWPTAFALLVAASGGGVNGAVTFFMLAAPVLLGLYEVARAGVPGRVARGFATRTVVTTLALSLWWLIPAYIQSGYGTNFLQFTEQPGTIWATTSATESLRLMGFWDTYLGFGFGGSMLPAFSDAHTLLFDPPVLLATLLVPALALTGFVWTRRWRYGPFFLGLALLGVITMMAGFPQGTLLRHGFSFLYTHVASLRVLRTTYKAGAVVALALACLSGAGADELWRRLRGGGWIAHAVVVVAGAALVAFAAQPLVTGHAQEPQLSWKRIPPAWRSAASAVDRMPGNQRAAVLPGDLFAFYTWGGTSDPILPALSRRPVAERAISPYADLRASDLLWTTDGLLQQQRLLPGQLGPLLRLMSIGDVVTGSDDDRARSAAVNAVTAAAELRAQGLGAPSATFGPMRTIAPAAGELMPATPLPEVRLYHVSHPLGIVRVQPQARPVIVDGSAQGLAALAGFGQLPGSDHALLYAGDLSAAAIRRAGASGAQIVITDSNRRQSFVPSSLEQNVGPVLGAGETLSADGLIFDDFSGGATGSGDQTVTLLHGVSSLQAPLSPQFPQFPEHQPFAAVDGSATTAWLADPHLDPGRWYLDVGFPAPRNVPAVVLIPYDDSGASVEGVQIAGRTFAIHPGVNRLGLGLHHVSSLHVLLSGVRRTDPGAAPGIRELRIPGIRVSTQLRLPTVAAQALAGRDLSRSGLTYLFTRVTGDDPFRRNRVHGPWSRAAISAHGDAEAQMRRSFIAPAARSYAADAWVNAAAQAPDDALDRVAGYRGSVVATSSSRFEDRPAWRASSALDGSPATAWIGGYAPGQPAWIQWRTGRPTKVGSLTLVPAGADAGRPTRVRISWPGGASRPLPVTAAGHVRMRPAVRARSFRISILDAAPGPAAFAARGPIGAVGIAEITGVRGLARIHAPARRRLTSACGAASVQIAARVIRLRLTADRAAFEAGAPLKAVGCGPPVALPAGTLSLSVAPGAFAVDDLRLSSPAPDPGVGAGTSASGRVVDPGHAGAGHYDGIKVAVTAPSWLVLGESFNRGWRASCNGRDLGTPAVIGGYANGWRVRAGCRDVAFSFLPNRLALGGYGLSVLALLVSLVLIAFELRRGAARTPAPADPSAQVGGDVRPEPTSLVRALGAGVIAGLTAGFTFGPPAAVIAAVGLVIVLRARLGARVLIMLGGVLLVVVVPALYILEPGISHAADQSGYAVDHADANSVGVAALLLFIAAAWRSLQPEPATRNRVP